MNLGVVTPLLKGYGGSEIYLLECLKRWQDEADITLYSPAINKKLLREFGIGRSVKTVQLLNPPKRRDRFGLLEEIVLLPRIWEQQLARHDLYFLYLFPTQMIRRHPSVWFAAEPPRMLYDLRYHSNARDGQATVHFYPKLSYDTMRVSELDVLLHVIERIDSEPRFDRLVTNSRITGQYIENVYGRKADAVAYPGIERVDRFAPPPTFDRVLHVGRLWRHKRVDLVLKAMAIARSPIVLTVVGRGPEEPGLRRLTRELGLEKKVVFRGNVSMAERERLYRESTCCVYAAVREPFGMVPLEAAAAGRPVVATIGGGYTEVLNDDAALFVPGDEGAIAQAIHRLMSNPRLAMKMGRAGQKIVARYTWDRTAETLMKLFRETRSTASGRSRRARPQRTQLGAHYYPWYRAGKSPSHWNENREFAAVTDPPLGGPYTSSSRTVIRRHLKQASRAGLDFLVVNWHVDFRGPRSLEVEATRRLLEEIERARLPMKICLLLAFNAEDPEVIRSTIRKARNEFMKQAGYLRHGRKPVLWLLLNDPFQGFLYHHRADLQQLTRGVHPVATGSIVYNKFVPRLLREFFSGWCLYSPLEVGDRKSWEVIWRESYHDFVEDRGRIRAFTICPGYDDSRLTAPDRKDNPYRRIPRRGSKTYELMGDVALSLEPRPDYVVVTSFNEFHENTHIEPSARFGDKFLKATRELRDRFCE